MSQPPCPYCGGLAHFAAFHCPVKEEESKQRMRHAEAEHQARMALIRAQQRTEETRERREFYRR